MAKLPELPPSPVLLKKEVPEKFRPVAFFPLLLVVAVLVLALVGLAGADFEWALLAGIVAGPAVAYVLVGPPVTRRHLRAWSQKLPRAPPEKRPLLFFPAFLAAAAMFYFILGIVATSTPLEEDLLALLALGIAIPAAVGVAYLLYGFPHPKKHLPSLRAQLEKVPAERRPYLFFPFGLIFAAPLYFLLGYAFTEILEPDIAVLLALALGLVLGFAGAYRLVGVPSAAALRDRVKMPDVPPRAQAPAFLAFVLIVGTLLAMALGGLIAGSLDAFGTGELLDLAFPLFLLAGWLLAVPVAGRLFGYPTPDRPWREYLPRLTADERPAALVPLTLGLGLVLILVFGTLLGFVPRYDLEDAALAALIAFPVAFLLSARILGIRLGEVDPRALEGMPERAKPLVIVALWLLLGTLLFAAIGQALTGFIEAVSLSYALSFAAALLLVDSPLVLGGARARKARKLREREIEARLRRELGLPLEEAKPAGTGSRFGRKDKGKA